MSPHDRIEPSTFDVVVASSGLVECLVASAFARAGKSVLLLDAADVYGSGHASFTFAGLCGSQDPNLNPHADESSTGTAASSAEVPPDAWVAPVHAAARLPVSEVSSSWSPGQALSQTRGFILDLAPKVLYQAEPLVDVLVRTRAHNYVEFKALDGSFIYQGGRLRSIPASRSDIFKDRSLGLADKRALMSFLSACQEASKGQGPLQDALTSDQPFVQLLAQQGLSPALQDIVLYGILCCDSDQGATRSTATSSRTQQPAAATTAAQQPATATAAAAAASAPQRTSTASSSPQGSDSHGLISAKDALAALTLYAASLGRFGASAGRAHMAPSYGSGTLAEALVRHCAVKGCVTALRQRVVRLVQRSGHTQDTAQTNTPPACTTTTPPPSSTSQTDTTEPTAAAAAAVAAAPAASPAQAAGVTEGSKSVFEVVLETGQVLTCREGVVLGERLLRGADDHSSQPTSQDPSQAGTAAQLTVARAVAQSGPVAQPDPTHSTQLTVARAVAVLEGSMLTDPTQGLATLAFPPHTPPLANTQPVYGLQLSPGSGVAPNGRYLLYLSTVMPTASTNHPSSSHTASPSQSHSPQSLLEPVLALLARLPTDTPPPEQQQQSDAAVTVTGSETVAGSSGAAAGGAGAGTTAAADTRPQVLHAHYYTQHATSGLAAHAHHDTVQPTWHRGCAASTTIAITDHSPQASGGMNTVSTSRPRIVVCPGPTPTLFGCAHEITTAERILRHHFPSVPWLLDEEPPTQPATQTDSTDTGTSTHEGDEEGGEAGGQGGAGQGGANDNKTHDNKHDNTDDTEEDLAIDELEAALGSLLAVTEPSARQSDEAKALIIQRAADTNRPGPTGQHTNETSAARTKLTDRSNEHSTPRKSLQLPHSFILATLVLMLALAVNIVHQESVLLAILQKLHAALRAHAWQGASSKNDEPMLGAWKDMPCITKPLWWFAPFLDSSSFGQEAADMFLPLIESGVVNPNLARISLLQADCTDTAGQYLSAHTRAKLLRRLHRPPLPYPAIVVCHNVPLYMGRPAPQRPSCAPCPPPQGAAYAVARAMVEVTGVPQSHTDAIKSLDEIWVPSHFSRDVLTHAGIPPHKVHVIPPSVDTEHFNPGIHTPLDLEQPHLVFPPQHTWVVTAGQRHQSSWNWLGVRRARFTFLSVGKWEARKGWDVLIPAYLKAFTGSDPVQLILVTKAFSAAQSIPEEIEKLVAPHRSHHTPTHLPRLVVSSHLSPHVYAALLASADVFALATRGEGFGLPLIEAMSMGLPVIAPSWSGEADYLDTSVGYPVRYTITPVPTNVTEDWYRGYEWASPDPTHLSQLMRHVVSNPRVARVKGAAARARVLVRYSHRAVTALLAKRLAAIEAGLNQTQSMKQV